MNTQDFHYELPTELIAQTPSKERDKSRLLVPEGQPSQYKELKFSKFYSLCNEGDLLVLNDTRVIPARLLLKKETGANVEVMLERFISSNQFIALSRSNKPLKQGVELYLDNQAVLRYLGRQDQFARFELFKGEGAQIFHDRGHMPLPPYIQRDDQEDDAERYQTVYAAKEGAVAAPTAGLHFDDAQFCKLKAKGVNISTVTLHVGAGTFQPVKVDNVDEHKMHEEWIEVSHELVEKVKETKARGGRVIAVGTTTTRALESAAEAGEIYPYKGNTSIFIYPGYEFKVVDAMVTNFHLPKSTLLMMISAFSGKQVIFDAYQFAINKQYRFFSYGDAMFIQRQKNTNT